MVVIDIEKIPNKVVPEGPSLREERKRTGRYVAAGTAIFLFILGVYQALIQGTPEYAALFAPAVIMLVYVLWILHTSRHQNARRLLRLRQAASRELLKENQETVVSESTPEETVESDAKKDPINTATNSKHYNRSYSIA